MDIQMILGNEKEREEFIEDFARQSLGDTIKFLIDDERSENELLADTIYEDFVKCR